MTGAERAGGEHAPGELARPPFIKICGITRLVDAQLCADLGVERIGLNFWRGSVRCCEPETARAIVAAIGRRLEVVAVTVDASDAELELVRATGIERIQLHGSEADTAVLRARPAYKAVRLRDEESVRRALRAPGDEVLIDAFLAGMPGGSGAPLDHALASKVVSARRTWIAGGLTPDNVARTIEALRPYGVDVASGVEEAPGLKSKERVASFVRAVRGERPASPR